MFIMEWSQSDVSAMKRIEGPRRLVVCFTVVDEPLIRTGPTLMRKYLPEVGMCFTQLGPPEHRIPQRGLEVVTVFPPVRIAPLAVACLPPSRR